MEYKKYYGMALDISDDNHVCCSIQIGSGNMRDNSNIIYPVLFDINKFKTIKVVGEYILPQVYFELTIILEENKVNFIINELEENQFLIDLFKVPNYFEELENSTFFTEN